MCLRAYKSADSDTGAIYRDRGRPNPLDYHFGILYTIHGNSWLDKYRHEFGFCPTKGGDMMAVRKPVLSRINATDARQFFGNVIKRAYTGGEHLVVEKNDLPVVVIVPIADYEEMRQALALQNLQELGRGVNSRARAKHLSPEDLEEQLEETKRQLYQQRYA